MRKVEKNENNEEKLKNKLINLNKNIAIYINMCYIFIMFFRGGQRTKII